MKRIAVLAAAALMVATPVLAQAAPAKASKRTLTYDYQGFQAFSVDAAGSGSAENPCAAIDACWDFSTVKGEKTVTFSVADGSGTPAGIQVFVDDTYDAVATFCGTGTLTVSPKRAALVSVRPAIADTCQAVPTSGTITAVVTNK